MSFNTAKVVAAKRGITAKFDTGYAAGRPLYPLLTTPISSDGAFENYAWLGAYPGMQEWFGQRQFHQLRAAEYTLYNRTWESSLAIDRHDIDDDQLNMYGPVAEQLGVEASYHPDELLVDLLTLAESTVGWDGQFFFDTDHSWGDSGTQSNDLSYTPAAGGGNAIVAADIKGAFNNARRALIKFKNDRGKLLNRMLQTRLNNLTVLIPPDLDQLTYDALVTTNQFFANGVGGDNVVIDAPKIEIINGWTATRKMIVMNGAAPMKPFVFQRRQRLIRQTKGGNDIEEKEVKFMTEARYAMGFGLWWTACLVTFA